jgi:hypothetical protein
MSLVCRVRQNPRTSEQVLTCVYMSYRLNESFVSKQQREKCVSVVYCWQKNERQESGAADTHKVWHEDW